MVKQAVKNSAEWHERRLESCPLYRRREWDAAKAQRRAKRAAAAYVDGQSVARVIEVRSDAS